jgi:hypothetical protein
MDPSSSSQSSKVVSRACAPGCAFNNDVNEALGTATMMEEGRDLIFCLADSLPSAETLTPLSCMLFNNNEERVLTDLTELLLRGSDTKETGPFFATNEDILKELDEIIRLLENICCKENSVVNHRTLPCQKFSS